MINVRLKAEAQQQLTKKIVSPCKKKFTVNTFDVSRYILQKIKSASGAVSLHIGSLSISYKRET